ncbi:MAG: flagellar basal body-associated protein FliL, partial [Planctomycetaceae bacterium]
SAEAGAAERGLHPRIPAQLAFVPFGDVTVNLDDGRLSRYLHLSFSLQIEKKDQLEVTKLMEDKKAILRNWLLSYLSDKGMEDIRGAAGQNRIRREIQDQFNTILFPDGYDRIYDVLFEEFNVQ